MFTLLQLQKSTKLWWNENVSLFFLDRQILFPNKTLCIWGPEILPLLFLSDSNFKMTLTCTNLSQIPEIRAGSPTLTTSFSLVRKSCAMIRHSINISCSRSVPNKVTICNAPPPPPPPPYFLKSIFICRMITIPLYFILLGGARERLSDTFLISMLPANNCSISLRQFNIGCESSRRGRIAAAQYIWMNDCIRFAGCHFSANWVCA